MSSDARKNYLLILRFVLLPRVVQRPLGVLDLHEAPLEMLGLFAKTHDVRAALALEVASLCLEKSLLIDDACEKVVLLREEFGLNEEWPLAFQ